MGPSGDAAGGAGAPEPRLLLPSVAVDPQKAQGRPFGGDCGVHSCRVNIAGGGGRCKSCGTAWQAGLREEAQVCTPGLWTGYGYAWNGGGGGQLGPSKLNTVTD